MSLEKSIRRFTNQWVANMKESAPYRTGRLKDSIEALPQPQPAVDMVYYGQFVDGGTKYMDAQPFIGPSYEKALKANEDLLFEGIFEAITTQFNKTLDK